MFLLRLPLNYSLKKIHQYLISETGHAQESLPGFFAQHIQVAQSKSVDDQTCALMGVRKPAANIGREMKIWKINRLGRDQINL